MRKIGREVLFLNTSENNPRNGEGDFIRLNDGRIMYAYTEFIGDHWGDNAIAHIAAVFSTDEGETWGDKKALIQTDKEELLNLMAPSLLRMNNGDIGIVYGGKYISESGDICTRCWLQRTNDDFKTLSEPVVCFDREGYYVAENARIVKLSSGRIIFPVNLHPTKGMEVNLRGETCYFISDDDGKTFYDSGAKISNPFLEDTHGLQETGVVEMENGRLFSFSRTNSGSQFESFSEDGGLSWSAPKPSIVFSSPVSPMHVRHLTNDTTIAVFNPKIALGPETTPGAWARTPLAAYICKGKGENFWKNASFYLLEDDLRYGYCYPAVFSGDDYFLCAYYHSNGTDHCLDSCKMVKVKFSELN